jgi:hypothetical protein
MPYTSLTTLARGFLVGMRISTCGSVNARQPRACNNRLPAGKEAGRGIRLHCGASCPFGSLDRGVCGLVSIGNETACQLLRGNIVTPLRQDVGTTEPPCIGPKANAHRSKVQLFCLSRIGSFTPGHWYDCLGEGAFYYSDVATESADIVGNAHAALVHAPSTNGGGDAEADGRADVENVQ